MEGPTSSLFIATVVCLFGALLPAGHSLGVINQPEKVIRAWIEDGLTARGHGLSQVAEVVLWATVVSLFVAGATVGNALAPKVADRVGRVRALLLIILLNIASASSFLACSLLPSVELLLIGRILSGLATGLSTCIVSLYLSEVCPNSLRGVFSAFVPLGFTSGMLIAYVASMPYLLGNEHHWAKLMGIPLLYSMIGIVLLRWCKESPVFVAMKLKRKADNVAIAEKRTMMVDSKGKNHQLPLAMKSSPSEEGEQWTVARIVKDEKYRKVLLFVFLLNIGQQLSGVNAIFYYSMLVFRSAGLDEESSSMATLVIFIVNLVMAAVALVLIKKFRRKSLLAVSLVGVLTCLVILVASLSLLNTLEEMQTSSYNLPLASSSSKQNIIVDSSSYQDLGGVTQVGVDMTTEGDLYEYMEQKVGLVAMVAMISYIFFYGVGLGPIPFCYAAESFPSGPRSVGVAVGGVANWGANCLVGLTFPLLEKCLGHFAFCVFIACVILLLVAVMLKLPEPGTGVTSREDSVRSTDTVASCLPEKEDVYSSSLNTAEANYSLQPKADESF